MISTRLVGMRRRRAPISMMSRSTKNGAAVSERPPTRLRRTICATSGAEKISATGDFRASTTARAAGSR